MIATDIQKRLFRRPGTTVLWLTLVVIMSAFLTVAVALRFSSIRLARAVNEGHTAIAVRTDRAVSNRYDSSGEGSGVIWEVSDRTFSREEKSWLESLDSVEAVRIHSLCAGYSPELEAVLGVRREYSWSAGETSDPYFSAMFSGTVVKVLTWGVLLEVDEVISLHSEYLPPLTTKTIYGVDYLYYYFPDYRSDYYEDGLDAAALRDYFQSGQRYMVSGLFIPSRVSSYASGNEIWAPILYAGAWGALTEQDGVLTELLPDDADDGQDAGDRIFPSAAPMTGSSDDFFADPANRLWQLHRGALDRQIHSLPVLGTESLESLYLFVRNEAAIIEGRSFSREEYDAGARVMVLSEAVAQKCGLSVGDTVHLSQYLCAGANGEGNFSLDLQSLSGRLHRPSIGILGLEDPELPVGKEESFTVVGIYRMQDYWSYDSYAFTANAVFIPQKAQIPGAFGPEAEDLYGVYLTVELKNGMVDEFRLAASQSRYKGTYYTFDQGYEQLQKNLNGLANASARLLWIAVGAWVILLLLYLLMFQSGQRVNLGIMRSLGASPRQAGGYLFGSGALVACVGVAAGAALGGLVLRFVHRGILRHAVAQIDQTVMSGTVLSEETLTGMVRTSSLSASQLLLLALIQLAAMALPLWIQARYLAAQRPRKLMGV